MGSPPPFAVLPLPPPELPPLMRAATMDSVLQAMASVPTELRNRNDRHIVLLRGQRRGSGQGTPPQGGCTGHRNAQFTVFDVQLD